MRRSYLAHMALQPAWPDRARAPLPEVAVVVATRGRPHLLPDLVAAVLEDPGARELVVVVDGEQDVTAGPTSAEVLDHLAARHERLVPVTLPRSGQLRALATGVERATAEVVLLLDDDVLPTCELASGHARRHQGRAGLVVVGTMPVALPGTGRASAGTELYARDYARHLDELRSGAFGVLDHLWTGNVSLRRADCLAVGLARTSFRASYHADRELGLRLADHGLSGVLDEELTAVHLHRRTNRAFLDDARRHGAGLVELHAVHGERIGPFSMDQVVSGLPPLLRRVVTRAGTSRVAPGIARAVAGVADVLGAAGFGSGRACVAKLARRMMVCFGARYGERPPPGGGADPLALRVQ